MEKLATDAAVLAVQLYLAVTLGVSGLAKLDDVTHFAVAMDRYRLFPAWSIVPLARVIPAAEVAVAASLVLGTAAFVTSAAAVALCASFLALQTVLVATKRAVDCGCHGRAYQARADGASIAVSATLFLLSAGNLYAVWSAVSVAATWRLPFVFAYGGAFLWILSRMLRRRRIHNEHHRAPAAIETALQQRQPEPATEVT